MISKNGMKFKFSAGEKVLCYEPDPTKAKVLYDSKVLELCISKDKRRKVPEYLIHFSGWSSSWDRCVTEEFILKDTLENRHLQRKLAEAAVVQIKSKKQKRKLNAILKDSYRYNKKGNLNSSDDDDSDESKNSDDSDSDSSFQSASGSEVEEEQEEEPAELTLKIPELLKKKLDEDYAQIKQKNKLVKLPCEPTVSNILEGYVKTYATNELCLTSDNRRCVKKDADIETNINLCKEVMDGLRIYFDFTLSLVLLYNEEKEQHNFYMKHYSPNCSDDMEESVKATPVNTPLELKIEQDTKKSTADVSINHHSESVCLSPNARSRKCRNDSILQLSPQPGKSPKSPIPKQIKREPPDDSEIEPPKRVLRSAAVRQEVLLHRSLTLSPTTTESGASTHPDASCGVPQSEDVKESKVFKFGTRSQPHRQAAAIAEALILKSCNSTRSGPSSPLPSALVSSPVHPSNAETSLVAKPTTSTSLPAPVHSRSHLSSISSCSSKSGPSSPASVVATNSAQKITNALNEAMQWRMIPSYVYKQKPTPPSLIYGAHHLLRLFVKLPDMINKTNMSANKLHVLETHLESFLSYLAQRQEDFFPANAYINFTDTFQVPDSSSSPTLDITSNPSMTNVY